MVRLSSGELQAFSILVERHTDRFYGAAFRIVGVKEDAEDIVQDCFLMMLSRPGLWNPDKGARFTTWFYRIVVNRSVDRIRRRKTVPTPPEDFDSRPSDLPPQDEAMEKQQERERVEAAIANLPPRQRAAIALCYGDDLSQAQAADAMGIHLKALESLLTRARATLKQTLHAGRDKEIAA